MKFKKRKFKKSSKVYINRKYYFDVKFTFIEKHNKPIIGFFKRWLDNIEKTV